MRTDDQCLRTFIELRAFIWGWVNDNWNIQINPLAAPVFQQAHFMSKFLVAHTKSG